MESREKISVIDDKYGKSGWTLWLLSLASMPFMTLFFCGLSYLILSGTIANTLLQYVLILYIWLGSGYALFVGILTIILAPRVVHKGTLTDQLEVVYFYGRNEVIPYINIGSAYLSKVNKFLWRSMILERNVKNLVINLKCGKTIYLSGKAKNFNEFSMALMQELRNKGVDNKR